MKAAGMVALTVNAADMKALVSYVTSLRGSIRRNIAGFCSVVKHAGENGIACHRRGFEDRVQRTGALQSTWLCGLSWNQWRRWYGGGFGARRHGQELGAGAPDQRTSASYRQDAKRWNATDILERRRIEGTRRICKLYFRLERHFPLRLPRPGGATATWQASGIFSA